MLRHLIFISLIIGLMGCASNEINSDTPEGLYKLAKQYQKDERYEEALVHFGEIKNKHPYSRFAIESELAIADIHYFRESYVEAENSYKLFKEFHPKHPKSDYVTFRIAMSIYKQLPDSIDRDLSLARDAILYFKQVYTTYPDSDYAGSAQDHKNKCLLKLARKEYYIAHFYFIRDMYDSALSRYEGILNNYSNLGMEPRSLYGAAASAIKLEKRELAKNYYNKLVSEFPKSKWTKKAKSDLKEEL